MDRTTVQAEIRYAQRLRERTARLYRKVQTIFTFFTILAGSAALVAVSAQLHQQFVLTSALVFAAFTAINIAVRPAERVAQNDSDVKKYASLLAKSEDLDIAAIRKALAEARQSDVPEIESLREVAFNDVMLEIGRPDAIVTLGRTQRLLSAIA